MKSLLYLQSPVIVYSVIHCLSIIFVTVFLFFMIEDLTELLLLSTHVQSSLKRIDYCLIHVAFIASLSKALFNCNYFWLSKLQKKTECKFFDQFILKIQMQWTQGMQLPSSDSSHEQIHMNCYRQRLSDLACICNLSIYINMLFHL